MKRKIFSWQIMLGITLVLLSAFVYGIHYFIFKDSHHIFIYLLGDIAFVPVEVLLVTLIINRLMAKREKSIIMEKLNMIIGAFYSEAGTMLISYFSDINIELNKIKDCLIITNDWSEKEFSKIHKQLKSCEYNIDIRGADLGKLRSFLLGKREFFMRLLENPSLLEHELFTDLLWAVFHLTEELSYRKDLTKLPDADYEHLEGDIKRVYGLLMRQWMNYMKHLKKNYPYLFSLAMRTNPFDQNASTIIS